MMLSDIWGAFNQSKHCATTPLQTGHTGNFIGWCIYDANLGILIVLLLTCIRKLYAVTRKLKKIENCLKENISSMILIILIWKCWKIWDKLSYVLEYFFVISAFLRQKGRKFHCCSEFSINLRIRNDVIDRLKKIASKLF